MQKVLKNESFRLVYLEDLSFLRVESESMVSMMMTFPTMVNVVTKVIKRSQKACPSGVSISCADR